MLLNLTIGIVGSVVLYFATWFLWRRALAIMCLPGHVTRHISCSLNISYLRFLAELVLPWIVPAVIVPILSELLGIGQSYLLVFVVSLLVPIISVATRVVYVESGEAFQVTWTDAGIASIEDLEVPVRSVIGANARLFVQIGLAVLLGQLLGLAIWQAINR